MMTYAPAPSTQPMTRQRGITWRYVSAHPLPKRHHAPPPRQYVSERFSDTVAISPPIVSAYYLQAPNWDRELSFREAVLPLMYRVKEDGLQTANAFRNALHSGDAKRGGAAARLAVVRAIAYASSRNMPACLLLALCGSHG